MKMQEIPEELKEQLAQRAFDLSEACLEALYNVTNDLPENPETLQIFMNTIIINAAVQMLRLRFQRLSKIDSLISLQDFLAALYDTYILAEIPGIDDDAEDQREEAT